MLTAMTAARAPLCERMAAPGILAARLRRRDDEREGNAVDVVHHPKAVRPFDRIMSVIARAMLGEFTLRGRRPSAPLSANPAEKTITLPSP